MDRLTLVPGMSPLGLARLKGASKRGPRRTEFEIEKVTGVANNLQPSTHDFSARMPEVDHLQKIPMSWRQRSPCAGHALGIDGIVCTAIRLPPVAKTLIERQLLITLHRRLPALPPRAPGKPDIAQDLPRTVRYPLPATLPSSRRAEWRAGTFPLACVYRSSIWIDPCTARPVVGARSCAFRHHSKT